MKKTISICLLFLLSSCGNSMKNFDCSYQKNISVNTIRFSLYNNGNLQFNGRTAKDQKELTISVKRGSYVIVPVISGSFSGTLKDVKNTDSLCIDNDCDDNAFKNICLM